MSYRNRLRSGVIPYVSLFFGLLLAVFVVGAGSASAHNEFVNSSPRDGEILSSAPKSWIVEFAKDVPLASASAEVILSSGSRVQLEAPIHGVSQRIIIFSLPVDLSENVTARWRLVGTDGHVISGRISFSVQASSIGTSNTSVPTVVETPVAEYTEESSTVPEPLRVALRYGTYVAILLIGGLLFIELKIATGALASKLGQQLQIASSVSLAVAPLLGLLILISDLRFGSESFFDGLSSAWSLTIGKMLIFRLIVGLVVVLVLSQIRTLALDGSRRLLDGVYAKVAILLGFYLIALAYGGHSRSQRAPLIGIPTDALHVGAVAVWIGGLVVLLMVVIPSTDVQNSLIALNKFSVFAERAVIVLVVTGLMQSVRLHNSVSSIFGSTHGVLLLTKVAIVAAMLRYAARNRRVLAEMRTSRVVNAQRSRTALVQSSIVEVGLSALVVGISAILVAVSP